MAAVVATALTNLLRGGAPVPAAVQVLAAQIAMADQAPCPLALRVALAARTDLLASVAVDLLAAGDETLAVLATNPSVSDAVVVSAIGAVDDVHKMEYLAGVSTSVRALGALADRVQPHNCTWPVTVGDRTAILVKLLENPALDQVVATRTVLDELAHVAGNPLAATFPDMTRRPVLAAALGWLRDHPAVCARLAADPAAHHAVLVAAAYRDPVLASWMLTCVILPGLDVRSGTPEASSSRCTLARDVVRALVATLPLDHIEALRAARTDWDTYADGALAFLLTPPAPVLDHAAIDALLTGAPVPAVLAAAAAWRTFVDAHPTRDAVRAFLARPDVDAASAAAVARVFDLHCSHALDARPGDVAYLAALYAAAPGRMVAVTDVDVLLAAVRVMADPSTRGGVDRLGRLQVPILERLAGRVGELGWAAVAPLLGRSECLDTAVADLLAALLATDARRELFAALAPTFTCSLGDLGAVFDATLAAPAGAA